MSVDEIEKMVKRNTKNKLIHEGRKIGLFLAGSGFTKYQMIIEINKRLAEIELQKAIDDARTITVEAIDKTPAEPEIKALPAPASQTTKRTRKSKQEIVPFQLGMFYIANIDGRNFNARVTAFIEHFSKSSKADKNGKIKNKIVRTKKVCFDVLYNGEIKHVEAGIKINKDSGCEYILDNVYPPVKMSADNPVYGATPHSASDITPEYKFKLEERYPLTIHNYYGNIKCVSFCNASQVTFEFGAYNSEAYREQDLLIVPVFVDPETKSQFILLGDRTCYAHDSNQENKPQETSQNVQQETKSENQQELKCCIFCGSKKKPYIRTRKGNNYKSFRSGFWASGVQSWFTVRIKCRFCGKEVECSGNTKEEAMRKAITKWNCEHIKPEDKPIIEHAPEQTRTPYKRVQVTAEDISSCQNENDAVNLLLTLKKEEIFNIGKELGIKVNYSKMVMRNGFNTKEKRARHIAHQLFLMRKIQAKKTSIPVDAPKTVDTPKINKLENFYYSMNEKTGQISFIFD